MHHDMSVLVNTFAIHQGSRDVLDQDNYEQDAQPGQGHRDGLRTGDQKMAEGRIAFSAPQIAGRDEPYRSQVRAALIGHTERLVDLAVEMPARGPSARDIEDTFREEDSRLLVSRTAISKIGERLWEDCQEFCYRDLGGNEVAYPFVDGIATGSVRTRSGGLCRRLGESRWKARRFAAVDGGLQGGPRDRVGRSPDMRGSPEPRFRLTPGHAPRRPERLAAGGGAPGIAKAIETCFPRSVHQRCPAHRMLSILTTVSEDAWSEFKTCATALCQAPSRAIDRDLAEAMERG